MHTTVIFVSILIVLYLLTRTNAKERFSGFKKYGNSNFRGGDLEQVYIAFEGEGGAGVASSTLLDKKKECAERCTAKSECKGFTVSNKKNKDGKWKCWIKDETAITGDNRKEDKTKTSYIKNEHYDYWTKKGVQFSKVKTPAPPEEELLVSGMPPGFVSD